MVQSLVSTNINLTRRSTVSRVQLALNVADLDAGRRLLHEALRRRAGEAPSRIRQLRRRRAAAQAGAHRGRRGPGQPEPPRRRGGDDRRRSPTRSARLAAEGLATAVEDEVSCCYARAGQGLGRRSQRRAVGDLHGARRRRDGAGRAPHGRPRERCRVLRSAAPTSPARPPTPPHRPPAADDLA